MFFFKFFFALSVFFPWVAKPQLNHWTKQVVSTKLIT